jgi:hypothetical protein
VPSYINSIALGDVADGAGSEIIVSYGFRCPPCGVQVVDGSNNIVWNFAAPYRLGQAVTGDLSADGRAHVVVGEWDDDAITVYAATALALICGNSGRANRCWASGLRPWR